MTGLLMGFEDFGTVVDNPSARIARALDGLAIIGRSMPVSFVRSIEVTETYADRWQPRWILGIGVAVDRQVPTFERYGTPACGTAEDVDGCRRQAEGERRVSGLPLHALAEALGAEISDDAGDYVCNAWLHEAIARFAPLPVGFLHVPAAGIDPEALRQALTVIPRAEVG